MAAPMMVVRPGDHVLVAVGRSLSREQTEQWATYLRSRFPAAEFTVVPDVAGVVVFPHDDEEAEVNAEHMVSAAQAAIRHDQAPSRDQTRAEQAERRPRP